MRRGLGIGVALGAALLLAPAARAADKEAIQKAVDRGVAHLKGVQGADGSWTYKEIGATALCGLALLEGGVKADDPAVQKAAKAVREQSIALTKTYSLALAIMFLDRLGGPADAELIESMAVRLLAGQDRRFGGWTYECPPLAEAEVRRLRDSLQQRRELVARPEPPAAPERRPTAQDLPREIQQQLQQVNQQAPAAGPNFAMGDNSNTQFAVLALWIARRKGIPVETALQRIDNRFRTTQRPDGSWPYLPTPNVPGMMMQPPGGVDNAMSGSYSTASMTCAGLLGLALSHGSALETTLRAGPAGGAGAPARRAPPDFSKDPVIRNALLFLGKSVGKPFEREDPPPNRPAVPPNAPPNFVMPQGGSPGNGKRYYFLFSLERVAMVYGLETIGDKNWYTWGADALLKNQNADGSWTGDYAEAGSDTCFALLFLRRANLAQDLTATLKGQVKDPGQHQLRAVEDIDKGVGTRPAPETGDRAPGNAQAAVDPEVARLSDELVKADAGRQGQVLRKLRDSKGAVYTDALAHAIPRLDGDAKGKARDALADRLARMTAATLKDKLQDDDVEVRRAAALACAMKEERTNVPRLIEMLEDPEPGVARAARAALKSLAGRDLGAQAAPWKEWWDKNGGK